MKRGFLIFAVFIAVSAVAGATSLPDEHMDNSVLQARAETLYRAVRCVVCQSESIADSRADVAKDMRGFIRARLSDGKSDAEILASLRESYGDSVLMRPPVTPATWMLWGAPFALLAAGGLVLAKTVFGKGRS